MAKNRPELAPPGRLDRIGLHRAFLAGGRAGTDSILRKTCQGNRSEQGAAVQAVLMSVYRALKLRGHDLLDTIVSALRTYFASGQLPPLPAPSTADG